MFGVMSRVFALKFNSYWCTNNIINYFQSIQIQSGCSSFSRKTILLGDRITICITSVNSLLQREYNLDGLYIYIYIYGPNHYKSNSNTF